LESDYHLVLNPIFIFFESGTLEKLCEFMVNLNVGHVMPKVTYLMESFSICKTNPTFLICLQRFYAFVSKKAFQKRMDKYEYKDQDYDKVIYEIPYLSVAFMFLRTNTLKKLVSFDDKKFYVFRRC
jgi:hypothetical protein